MTWHRSLQTAGCKDDCENGAKCMGLLSACTEVRVVAAPEPGVGSRSPNVGQLMCMSVSVVSKIPVVAPEYLC